MINYTFTDDGGELTEGRIVAAPTADVIDALGALAIDFGYVNVEFTGNAGNILGCGNAIDGQLRWRIDPRRNDEVHD